MITRTMKFTGLEIIQLLTAGALFLAPWIFGFVDIKTAAWSAWLSSGGLAIFTSLVSVGEPHWAGWGTLPFGLWAMLAPVLLGFPADLVAWWAHILAGAVATFASLALLYLTMSSATSTDPSSDGMQAA